MRRCLTEAAARINYSQSSISSVALHGSQRQRGVCGARTDSADQKDCGPTESWHFKRVNDRVDKKVRANKQKTAHVGMASAIERHGTLVIENCDNYGNNNSSEVGHKRSCRYEEHGGREPALPGGPQVILGMNGTALQFDPNAGIAGHDEQENNKSGAPQDVVKCSKRDYFKACCYARANWQKREKPDNGDCDAIVFSGEYAVSYRHKSRVGSLQCNDKQVIERSEGQEQHDCVYCQVEVEVVMVLP